MATDPMIEERVERYMTKDDLSPDGAGNGLLNNGMRLELGSLVGLLKLRRVSMGLTIARVARRSRLTEDAIRELEDGSNRNPHCDLVWRYALAMDAYPTLTIEEVEPEGEELEDRRGE